MRNRSIWPLLLIAESPKTFDLSLKAPEWIEKGMRHIQLNLQELDLFVMIRDAVTSKFCF